MAYYRQSKYGWRAEIDRTGFKGSKSGFRTKAAAQAWAERIEAELRDGALCIIPNLTVAALFTRYAAEVSKGKKGERWELIRLKALGRDPLALVRLRQLDAPHASDWQRRRLQAVSGASVRRERNLLNHVFQIGIKEWRWLRKNPFEGVRRPRDGKPRKRIATQAELDRLLAAASPKLARVIVFAVETGMRAGEIANLRRVEGRIAYVEDSKNNESREVPLSPRAMEVWNGSFGLTTGSISALFAKLCVECGIEGLTFHDIRATAATRLSKILNPLQLARMFGWKDLKQAMTYYRETTEDIAKLL